MGHLSRLSFGEDQAIAQGYVYYFMIKVNIGWVMPWCILLEVVQADQQGWAKERNDELEAIRGQNRIWGCKITTKPMSSQVTTG